VKMLDLWRFKNACCFLPDFPPPPLDQAAAG